jgi:small-conductance mechanosensitive channel
MSAMRKAPFHAAWALVVCVVAAGPVVTAQQTTPKPATVQSELAASVVQSDTSPATPAYANRPIIEFRAAVLGRQPAERAVAARQAMERLVDAGTMGPVETRSVGPVMMVSIGGQDVFAIVPADVDTLTGATLETTAARAASSLQVALAEIEEARRPRDLAGQILQALLATGAFVAICWFLIKARTRLGERLGGAAARRLQATKVGDDEFMRSSRIVEFLQRLVSGVVWGLVLFATYTWLTFSLRRFPYTRYWGESLREFLLDRLSLVGNAILGALPGVFMVVVILLVTRFVARLVTLLFRAVQEGRINVGWLYPETAQPTKKLVVTAVWLFGAAMAYPYVPGSDSEAFKGISLLTGLMLSLGSSGFIGQVMSGFTLTYSRALKRGDFVSVGDVQGTVTQLGTLSTKIRTARNEDVTIPNQVVCSQIVTNYSRGAEAGVFVGTDVTLGYDVAWRQVEALLLLAAARTEGIRRQPAPVVRQTALQDAYIRYTLLFCLEDPATRIPTLAAVHGNILDAFNEYGVQITAPNYEADPTERKVVPPEKWFPAPAKPTGDDR